MINVIDIGIILLLLMAFIVGFKKGLIKEAVSLVGIIAVFIISYMLKGYLGDLLCFILPFGLFAGKLNGLVSLNILFYQLIAFIIVFSMLLGILAFVMKISGWVQKLVHMTIILWLPSKIGGGIVGFISGYITLFVVLITLLIPLGNTNLFKESLLVDKIVYKTPILSNVTNKITQPIKEVNELADQVMDNTISVNDANLRIIDDMLEYKIVSKATVNRLVELNKLNGITNIESILNKY